MSERSTAPTEKKTLLSRARGQVLSADGSLKESVVGIAAAMIVGQLLFRAWAVYGGWFQFDDFVFIQRTSQGPLSLEMLFQGYGGHLMPGGFFLTWLFTALAPLNYFPFATTLLLLQAVCSVGAYLLLRSLFGDRMAILPLLALYLFSAISLPAFIWWAAGINQLGLQIALTWGLLAHLTYLRTRDRKYLVLTLVAMVAGLLLYEKTLLVYGAIAVLTLGWFATGTFFARLKHVWTTYRPAVIAHVACGALYLAFYGWHAWNFGEEATGEQPFLKLFNNLVAKSYATGVLGGPLNWEELSGPFQTAAPALPTVVIAVIVLALLVWVIEVTYANSRRAYFLLGFFLLCNLALLSSARASVLGAVVGLEYRYLTEMSLITALTIGLAMLPIRGALETPVVKETAHEQMVPGRSLIENREWLSVLTIVVVVLSFYSSYGYAKHWRDGTQSKEYFATADKELGTAKEPTALINTSVPQYLMWGYEYPRNTLKYVLSMHRDRMTFPEATAGKLQMLDGQGKLRPVGIGMFGNTSAPQYQSEPAPPGGNCGYQATRSKPAKIRFAEEVTGSDSWASVVYSSTAPAKVRVEAGEDTYEVDVPQATTRSGGGRLYFNTHSEFDTIEIAQTSGSAPICFYNAQVGTPFPLFGDIE